MTQNKDSINQVDIIECEEDEFYLLPFSSSPSFSPTLESNSSSSSAMSPSILLTEDTNDALVSLVAMLQSSMFGMRIESLQIFAEILGEQSSSADRRQIVEALYRLNILRIFVENFIQLVHNFDSQFNQSDIFFEFHLLTLILSRIIQIQISQVSHNQNNNRNNHE